MVFSTSYRNRCATNPQALLPDTSQIPTTPTHERAAQLAFSFQHTIQPRRTVQTTAATTSHARDQPPCKNALRYGHQIRCGARRHHSDAAGQRRTLGTQRLTCGSQPSGVQSKRGNFEISTFRRHALKPNRAFQRSTLYRYNHLVSRTPARHYGDRQTTAYTCALGASRAERKFALKNECTNQQTRLFDTPFTRSEHLNIRHTIHFQPVNTRSAFGQALGSYRVCGSEKSLKNRRLTNTTHEIASPIGRRAPNLKLQLTTHVR
jgi:hypothetical protein